LIPKLIVAPCKRQIAGSIGRFNDPSHRNYGNLRYLLIPRAEERKLAEEFSDELGLYKIGARDERLQSSKQLLNKYGELTATFLLQNMLGKSEELATQAAGVLRTVAWQSDLVAKLVDAGFVEVIVEYINKPDAPLSARIHALNALANFSDYNQGRIHALNAGAIPIVVNYLESGTDEVDGSKEAAAAVLYRMSKESRYCTPIVDAGAIPPLLRLLNHGTREAKMEAAAALGKLTSAPELMSAAKGASIILVLAQLLQEGSKDIQHSTVYILRDLAENATHRQAIVEAGVVPVLLQLHANGSAEISTGAAKALERLGFESRGGSFLCTKEALFALIRTRPNQAN
jgi:HEAT repeat protein